MRHSISLVQAISLKNGHLRMSCCGPTESAVSNVQPQLSKVSNLLLANVKLIVVYLLHKKIASRALGTDNVCRNQILWVRLFRPSSKVLKGQAATRRQKFRIHQRKSVCPKPGDTPLLSLPQDLLSTGSSNVCTSLVCMLWHRYLCTSPALPLFSKAEQTLQQIEKYSSGL